MAKGNSPEGSKKKRHRKFRPPPPSVAVNGSGDAPATSSSSTGHATNGLHVSRKRKQPGFQRPHLPIDDVSEQIIEILGGDAHTQIFLGETGSGKSTQLPKLCVKAGWCIEGGRIAITQPRRVAAVSLATRVAQELECELGDMVGYRVRFEAVTSENTSLLYMTDGILLREAILDPLLGDYTGIVVDEAHERSLHTDVLLAVIRKAQRRRADTDCPLRVVIMSATIHCRLFADYFRTESINVIQGRTYPIELFYADGIDPGSSDYVFNSIVTVLQLHRSEPIEHDILVFLTGREEIDMAVKKIRSTNNELEMPIHAVPLYAAMSPAQQLKVFEKAPDGHRKVIFSTNVAETSVTIPGIRIVIDPGKVKIKTFTPEDRIDVLRVQSTSQAQSLQRAGRAGREAPGKCYRLFPEKHFNEMLPDSVPEILRSNLGAVLLELMKIGWKNIEKLRLIEQPSEEAIRSAIIQLQCIKAIERKKNGRLILTTTGEYLLKFPVPPEHARVILSAANHDCLEEALWIVACMSGETVFTSEGAGDEESDRVRGRFSTTEGDHLTLLNVCNIFRKEKRKNKAGLAEFCDRNFFNRRNLNTVMKVRLQLRQIAMSFCSTSSCGGNRDLIRRALAEGLYMNACVYDQQEDRYSLMVNPGIKLRIHPSSALSRCKPRCFVFSDLVRTTDLYARDVTVIEEEWVQERVEEYKRSMREAH